jgi:ferrous iron transport protein A
MIFIFILRGGSGMALAMMGVGEKRMVIKVRGKDEVIRHLMDLGFAPGAEVLVVGENVAGMILMVKGVRVALDRGLASKIMVA